MHIVGRLQTADDLSVTFVRLHRGLMNHFKQLEGERVGLSFCYQSLIAKDLITSAQGLGMI